MEISGQPVRRKTLMLIQGGISAYFKDNSPGTLILHFPSASQTNLSSNL
jgi:hypothetical protein